MLNFTEEDKIIRTSPKIHHKYKIKDNEVRNIYNNLFERKYLLNSLNFNEDKKSSSVSSKRNKDNVFEFVDNKVVHQDKVLENNDNNKDMIIRKSSIIDHNNDVIETIKNKSQSMLRTNRSIDKRSKDSRISFNTYNSRPQTNMIIRRSIIHNNDNRNKLNNTEIYINPKKSYRKSNLIDIKSKCEYIDKTMNSFLNKTIYQYE